jgi:hypothetical protein
LESYQFSCFARRETLNFSHKTALFHTVSHFRGSVVTGQANSVEKLSNFANETKDLARFPQATSSQNVPKNEALS